MRSTHIPFDPRPFGPRSLRFRKSLLEISKFFVSFRARPFKNPSLLQLQLLLSALWSVCLLASWREVENMQNYSRAHSAKMNMQNSYRSTKFQLKKIIFLEIFSLFWLFVHNLPPKKFNLSKFQNFL